jgi:hypothetical protein
MSLLDSVQESERTLSEAHARLARIESEMDVDVPLRYFDISDLPDLNDEAEDDEDWEEDHVSYAHVVRGGGYRDEIVQIGGEDSRARAYRERVMEDAMAQRIMHESVTRRMMDESTVHRRNERLRALQFVSHDNPGIAAASLSMGAPGALGGEYYPAEQIMQSVQGREEMMQSMQGRDYIAPPIFRGRPESAVSASRPVVNRRAIHVRQSPDFTRARHHRGAHQFFDHDGHHDEDLLQMIMAPPRREAGDGDENSILLLNMVWL